MLSTIADIAGIISFLVSTFVLILSHSLFKNMQQQKTSYNAERVDIQSDLIALRQNIWDDNLDNIEIRSKLRQSLFSYRRKYFALTFPICIYHLQIALFHLSKPLKQKKREKLCKHIDYLIANLDKKEFIKNE